MEHPAPRRPDREDVHEGLAYTLWLPDRMGPAEDRGAPTRPVPQPPWPGVVILHGAGSRKENHADFARLATAAGWAALAFDLPGHGSSEGAMSPRVIEDVIRVVRLLAATSGVDSSRVALRGSSMGGFLALHAAAVADEVAGVIAICPAGEGELRRGLRKGDLEMRVDDRPGMEAWLAEHDLRDAVEWIAGRPLILLHAEGDDQIPSDWSEELFSHAADPCKLVVVPGGDHRSLQHDAEIQGMALRWLERELNRAKGRAGGG